MNVGAGKSYKTVLHQRGSAVFVFDSIRKFHCLNPVNICALEISKHKLIFSVYVDHRACMQDFITILQYPLSKHTELETQPIV